MAEKKINNAMATGAEYIVSTDVSCLIQMNSIIQKQNLPIKCIHIIDLLASGL
jgi:L-lactate dehydrogenase complex protein LldE